MEFPILINDLFYQFWIPFVRIAAMLMVMPIFGAQFIPKRVKLLLSIAVSVVVFPLLAEQIPASQSSLNMISIALIMIQQILIGAIIGLCVHIIFQAFIVAGEVCAMQMGLGFASMNDPQNGVTVPTLSQFYLTIVTLLFLSMNGHLYFIEIVLESFNKFPISGFSFEMMELSRILQLGAWIFLGGFKIALPAIAALLMVNMSISIMTKATPQINIFVIGFPLTMLIGMVILWFFSMTFLPQFTELFNQMTHQLKGWVH